MRFDDQTRIAVAGAGSIGCYAGACLALAGRKVALLARPRIVDAVTGAGLAVRDLDGTQRQLPAGRVQASADPAAVLANADIVLVTVKSGATQAMARLVARRVRPGAVVVSLQNGVENPAILRAWLGARHPVVAGMVPFNVVAAMAADGAPVFHRATEGTTLVDRAPAGLAAFLGVAGFPVSAAADMDAVLWGKLLLNLNNALNALSGLPLADELADRRWRRVLAVQIAEALGAMKAGGIRPGRIGRLRPGL
ncbi:MAG: 2-dehydropantoate 2-reductase, partial [Nitratireductor sp.]